MNRLVFDSFNANFQVYLTFFSHNIIFIVKNYVYNINGKQSKSNLICIYNYILLLYILLI